MPKDKKPNWTKIRIEYETTKTSYRKLATKYDVSFNTLQDRAKRENWQATTTETRQKITTKITEKTRQKFIDRQSERIASSLDMELEAAELISALILKTLKEDPEQFNKHLVTQRVKGYEIVDLDKPNFDGPIGSDNIGVLGRGLAEGPPIKSNKKLATIETQVTVEKTFEVLDTKRLVNLAAALEKSNTIKKEILGIIDAATTEKLDIERKKYELAKAIAEKGDTGNNETYEIVDPFAEEGSDDKDRLE